MMDDEDAVRAALRLMVDQRQPPVTTDLNDVLVRGRRRVRAQRALAAFGVVGVVAVVGAVAFAANALGHDPRPGHASVAGRPSATVHSTVLDDLPGWHQVTVASTPWPTVTHLPPGVPHPTTSPATRRDCTAAVPSTTEPTGTILPQATVQPVFQAAVSAVAGHATITPYQASWTQYDPKSAGPRGYVWLDVTAAGGQGSVELEAGRYGGTAEQAADADAYLYGDCTPPLRKVLPNGVIMQLYPAGDPSRAYSSLPVRYLGIYAPNGHHYIVDDQSWGSGDLTPVPGESAYTVHAGRATPVLSTTQLAELGERLAQLG